jgi:hypothetical protein
VDALGHGRGQKGDQGLLGHRAGSHTQHLTVSLRARLIHPFYR